MAAKKHRRTCRLTPGTRYSSRTAALAAANERKIQGAVNGQHGGAEYDVEPCRCGGVHLVMRTPG